MRLVSRQRGFKHTATQPCVKADWAGESRLEGILRHDFAHRAREAGWGLEEVAYYLGHITMKGTPAIQTTARYTQVSRAQVMEKLRLLKG